jgi:hypothetical protein
MRVFGERYRREPACWLRRVVVVVVGRGWWGKYLRRSSGSVNGRRRLTMAAGAEGHDTQEAWASCEGHRPS